MLAAEWSEEPAIEDQQHILAVPEIRQPDELAMAIL
jgi:hypothetical protein